MPSTIRIPLTVQRKLVEIGKLSKDAFEDLLRIMAEARVAFGSSSGAREVASKFVHIQPDSGQQLIEALLPLYFLMGSSGKLANVVAQNVAFTVSETTELKNELDERSLGALQERLKQLLEISSAERTAKAYALAQEAEHILSDVRVLTDLRPVFDDVDKLPPGAVVTHTLKLEYFYSGEARQMFLALNEKDLRKLSEVADRAIKKQARVAELLRKSGVEHIALDTED